MTRNNDTGICEHCGQKFAYYLLHNGFGDSAYAYCDSCEYAAILSGWHESIPAGAGLKVHQRILPSVEAFLKPCPCGGKFKADAGPRCPHCHQVLSPLLAKNYLEANAPGTKAGWRWQNNWSGVYSIVIADKAVRDWWK